MQVSLAVRSQVVGRWWGGAGHCVLPHPLPRAATIPRHLHQDPHQLPKDPEDPLDAFIVKFQQVMSRPKEWKAKGQFKRATNKAGKGAKTHTPTTTRPYQPFALRTRNFAPRNVATCEEKQIDAVVTGIVGGGGGGGEVRTGKEINKEREILARLSPVCDGRGVEGKEEGVSEDQEAPLTSHTALCGTSTEEGMTNTPCTPHPGMMCGDKDKVDTHTTHHRLGTDTHTTHTPNTNTTHQKGHTNTHTTHDTGHTSTNTLHDTHHHNAHTTHDTAHTTTHPNTHTNTHPKDHTNTHTTLNTHPNKHTTLNTHPTTTHPNTHPNKHTTLDTHTNTHTTPHPHSTHPIAHTPLHIPTIPDYKDTEEELTEEREERRREGRYARKWTAMDVSKWRDDKPTLERREEETNRLEEGKNEEGGSGERALSQRERALLSRILEGVPECPSKQCLQDSLRQNGVPSFELLRRVCAGVSQSACARTVVHIKALTQSLHPHLYLEHLGLDYYWASALCHGGDVEQSLAVLLHLHTHTHPHHHKKVCDMTQLVLYRIVEEGQDDMPKVLEFVDTIATQLSYLGPALSLWSATFTSPLFRVQQVSEWLMERHPGLTQRLRRRMEGLVEKAAWTGDQDLLQRLLSLALKHKMSAHYPAATSALLQLQCDMGDLRGAEETIKFSQKVQVPVSTSALHRYLALLSRHRRPAPLALLALKYRHPPTKQPKPPPPPAIPKYRF